MSWATHHIARLQAGETVQFRPRGGSMAGRIESGQRCTVAPLAAGDEVAVGDIVLCRVRGFQYLHLVKARKDGQYLIGNNRGRENGWTPRAQIFGRLVRVED